MLSIPTDFSDISLLKNFLISVNTKNDETYFNSQKMRDQCSRY